MFRLKKQPLKPVRAVSTQGDDDKENRTPTLQEMKTTTIDHALTMPRVGRPTFGAAEDENTTTDNLTPCFLSTIAINGSKSEPGPKVLRNITNMTPMPVPAFHDRILEESRIDRNEENTVSVARKRVKSENEVIWNYTCDKAGCESIVKGLQIDIAEDDLEGLEKPVDLFHFLERKRRLDSKVLRLFSKCPELEDIDMNPTYASRSNAIGLLEASMLPAKKCTVPLYGGYANLKVLDLTNVHIVDDDLRFLIKLGSLQALGLSGTKITNKGLKYLATHSQFKKVLRCLKLCYVEEIGASGLDHISKAFEALSELDLWGCNQLCLKDLKSLVGKSFQRIRVPADVHELVEERHHSYTQLSRKYPQLTLEIKEVLLMSDKELSVQLKIHREHFSDIYLKAPRESLQKRLTEILDELKIQEFLYQII